MDRRTAFAPRQLRHGVVLGQLYFEGRLVPHDVQEAVRLIDLAGQWDFAARQQVLRLLADNPVAGQISQARALPCR